MKPTDNLRIASIREVSKPDVVRSEVPLTDAARATLEQARDEVAAVLSGADDRLLMVVGPCSIHDPEAAKEYATRLAALKTELAEDLLILMRVYFEKPRTIVGWKGLINDPELDGSFAIDQGLRLARRLLVELNERGVPAGVEYLDLLTPQYLADLVSWGAIGARTTESQLHREIASGLSCAVGFKNGTDGNVQVAVDAIQSARHSHHFLSMTTDGTVSIFETTGNDQTHLILRGGSAGPNYSAAHIAEAAALMEQAGVQPQIMVDLSHANSEKQPRRQLEIAVNVGEQLAAGEQRIMGVMVESHLVEGNQKVRPDTPLTYGQSITDACLGWDETETLLRGLAEAVRARRRLAA